MFKKHRKLACPTKDQCVLVECFTCVYMYNKRFSPSFLRVGSVLCQGHHQCHHHAAKDREVANNDGGENETGSLVEVDQKRDNVVTDFHKALSGVQVQLCSVHHFSRIIEPWPRHGRPLHVPGGRPHS